MSDTPDPSPQRSLAQQKREHFLFLLEGLDVHVQRITEQVRSGELDPQTDAAVLLTLIGSYLQENLNLAWHCLRPGPFLYDRPDYAELRLSIPQWDFDHRLIDPFEGWDSETVQE